MSGLLKFSSIALVLATLSMPAHAAAAPAPQWVVDQSGYYCALATKVTGPPDATFVLRTLPGTGAFDVMLVGDRWPASLTGARKQITLTLLPGSASESRPAEAALTDRDRTISWRGVSGRMTDELGRSTALQVSADNKPVVRYALPAAAGAASQALAQCIAGKLIDAGADPAGFELGASPPKPIGEQFKWVDKPPVMSMGDRETLHAAAVLNLDPAGKPTDCNVLEVSGRFDRERLCQNLLERARYEPARDPRGHTVKSVAVYQFDEMVRDTITLETFGPG